MDLTPYEIVPILAENGIYVASESSFYRVLREEQLLNRTRKRKYKKNKMKGIEIKATKINEVWSYDITYLKTAIRGIYYYLYLFMDIYSRAITGWGIKDVESGEEASNIFRKICERKNINGVILHSDNGSPMRSGTMLATLQRLGVIPSFTRPSVSNDNAYSESLFKTLKYTVGYPGRFLSIEDAEKWMSSFVEWYNNVHRHSGIGYVTPMQRYKGEDLKILEKRRKVYQDAMNRRPERWSKNIRNWDKVEIVYLKRLNQKEKKIA